MIGRNDSSCSVKDISISYDKIGSDHLPLIITIGITWLEELNIHDNIEIRSKCAPINWEKLSNEDLKLVDDIVVRELSFFQGCEAMNCLKVGCRDRSHLRQLSHFYLKLCNAVSQARTLFIRRIRKRSKYKVIPGWNRNVKNLYSGYRKNYLKWLANGKLRTGMDFESMKETRKIFKNALNECKLNEVEESSLSIQEKYTNKDMKSFWMGVQQKIIKLNFPK